MEPLKTRRDFLKDVCRVGAAAATGPLLNAGAQEYVSMVDDLDRYDFIFPRVRFVEGQPSGRLPGPDVWNVRPGGDANLLEELSSVIRCRVKPIVNTHEWQPQYAAAGQLNAVVTFDDFDTVKPYPFLFMTGENYFKFDPAAKSNVKAYIERGGFIFMDDCVIGNGGDFFYQSAYAMLEELFGPGAVKQIPLTHEVFSNVYNLSESGLPGMEFVRRRQVGLPYMHGQHHGARGLFVGDRLAVFLSSTDLHCGWCDRSGIEFGRENYLRAIQMGVNVIMYAMMH
ncbi:MAG: DUF4159 domain-containing protein [Phycisphaerae bacterium]|nr:DUF4159 domain-containing protein [Phycisphaerae bacterium]